MKSTYKGWQIGQILHKKPIFEEPIKLVYMEWQIGQILLKKPIFEEPLKIVYSRFDPLETFPKVNFGPVLYFCAFLK